MKRILEKEGTYRWLFDKEDVKVEPEVKEKAKVEPIETALENFEKPKEVKATKIKVPKTKK